MGVNDLWTDVLGIFKYRLHQHLSKYQFATIGVDIDILFNKSQTDVTQFATTNDPKYASPDILTKCQEYHNKIVKAGVVPIYVFGGPAPLLKKEEKESRQLRRTKAANKWIDTLEEIQKDPNTVLSDKKIDDAISSRKQLSHPTKIDQANVLSWMKREGINVVGSFLEADQQLRKLEIDGIVDAIATEDGDLVTLGGNKVLSKSRTQDGKLSFRIFDRVELQTDPTTAEDKHLSKLFLYPDAGIDIALLLGNDYLDKMEGNGTTVVLENKDW
jgi:5'-3' exonuclease